MTNYIRTEDTDMFDTDAITEEMAESEGITTYDDDEVESAYQEMLDEIYGEVNICGLSYSASYAHEMVDPIAYRVGLSDYESEYFTELSD